MAIWPYVKPFFGVLVGFLRFSLDLIHNPCANAPRKPASLLGRVEARGAIGHHLIADHSQIRRKPASMLDLGPFPASRGSRKEGRMKKRAAASEPRPRAAEPEKEEKGIGNQVESQAGGRSPAGGWESQPLSYKYASLARFIKIFIFFLPKPIHIHIFQRVTGSD